VIGPSGATVEMDVRGTKAREDDYIIMVTREVLDRTMREKAQDAGAELREATFVSHEEQTPTARCACKRALSRRTRGVLTCDALDRCRRRRLDGGEIVGRPAVKHASAIQERLDLPDDAMEYYENRAELYLGDDISPDFYGWIFPKSDHVAVGTGCRPEHANAIVRVSRRRESARRRQAARREADPARRPSAADEAQQEARLRQHAARRRCRRHGRAHVGRGHLLLDGRGPAGRANAARHFGYTASSTRYEKNWQKKYGAMFDFLEFLEKVLVPRQQEARVLRGHVRHEGSAGANVRQLSLQRDGKDAWLKAALRNWTNPKNPLLTAPPEITAKQALQLTRAAVADGVGVDERSYANAT
jgi:geranylgeranyl reductase